MSGADTKLDALQIKKKHFFSNKYKLNLSAVGSTIDKLYILISELSVGVVIESG